MIESQTTRAVFTGNGVTKAFALPCLVLDKTHVKGIITDTAGTDVIQTVDVQFTVAGVGAAGGVTVTFVLAPTSGYTVTLYREVPYTQTMDYITADNFPAESHELTLDKNVMMSQQIADRITRALRISQSGSALTEIPSAPARANTVLGFDEDGLLKLFPVVDGTTEIPAATIIDPITSSMILDGTLVKADFSTPTWRALQGGVYNVMDYGATGDGATDDTAAIQAAGDACIAAGGGTVYFPKTSAFYRIAQAASGIAAIIFTTGGVSGISFSMVGAPGAVIKTKMGYTATFNFGFKFRGNWKSFEIHDLIFEDITTSATYDPTKQGRFIQWEEISGDVGINDVIVNNCTFKNTSSIALHLAIRHHRLIVTGCRFILDRNHVFTTCVCIYSYNSGYEHIITNNIMDGAIDNLLKDNGAGMYDGFYFGRLTASAIICNNIIKNYGIEGIYCNGWSTGGDLVTSEYEGGIIVANNTMMNTRTMSIVYPTARVSQSIVIDAPDCIITGNNIVEADSGIKISYRDAGYIRPTSCFISGNRISMRGKFAAPAVTKFGIVVLGNINTVISGNHITVKANDGTTPTHWYELIHVTSDAAADVKTIVANNILDCVTRDDAKGYIYGIRGGNETVIRGNILRNLYSAFYTNEAPLCFIQDNVMMNVTLPSTPTFQGKSVQEFVPSGTGWWRVASFAFGGMARVGIFTRWDYGNASYMAIADGTTKQQGTALLVNSTLNASTTAVAEITQESHRALNSGAVTEARFVDGRYLEIYVASITNAKPIVVSVESYNIGVIGVLPVATPGITTTQVNLTFGPGRIYSESNEPLTNGSLIRAGGRFLWMDSADKLRFHTATPLQSNENAVGTIIGP